MQRRKTTAIFSMMFLSSLFVLVIGLLGSTYAAAAAEPGADNQFSDVSSTYWAKPEIDYLTDREIISGLPDGSFGIRDPITRAQAATIMIRTLGWEVSGTVEDPGYPDIDSTHWAYNYIATMKSADFFAPEGKFEPNKNLTRAEMADMLVKTFDLRSASGMKFADLDRDHWAYDAINILAANQITVGYDDGTFRPENEVTRTEFAVFVVRTIDESYRPAIEDNLQGAITVYDVGLGDSYVSLDEPLLLRDTWQAPAELFQRLGWTVESSPNGQIHITTAEDINIELSPEVNDVWVGDTLVTLNEPVERIDGQFYIEASPILKALEKPLVFYPDERLVRIEAPRITASDIKARAPETILDVLHEEQPYWHWVKRDHDYLERIKQNSSAAGKLSAQDRDQLLEEMHLLTSAFYQVEREKTVVHGINYYSDHVTGKIDAVTRGLEARYLLLYQFDQYEYPDIGHSGSTGVWSKSNHKFRYTVADHMFEMFEERKQEIIEQLESNTVLPFEQFKGLTIYGVPFTIRELYPDGTHMDLSGKASGTHIVTNSSIQTFIHEFGHNWDAHYGDDEAYLAIRGKEGYTPPSTAWEHRVQENFAEDFVAAFLPEGYPSLFKAHFGEPTSAESEAFREWALRQMREKDPVAANVLSINGATLMPAVWITSDGQLQVEGETSYNVYAYIVNETTGQTIEVEIPSHGAPFEHTIQLPEEGRYTVSIGRYQMTVLYMK